MKKFRVLRDDEIVTENHYAVLICDCSESHIILNRKGEEHKVTNREWISKKASAKEWREFWPRYEFFAEDKEIFEQFDFLGGILQTK